MSGGLPTNIPTFNATGHAGAAPLVELTFGTAPPVDGSLGLCFVTLDAGIGFTYASGAKQRLAYFTDDGLVTGPGQADVSGGGSITAANLQGWSFVADAI